MTVCRVALEFAPSACDSKGETVHSGAVKQCKEIILGQLFANWFLSVRHVLENGLLFRCGDSEIFTFGPTVCGVGWELRGYAVTCHFFCMLSPK